MGIGAVLKAAVGGRRSVQPAAAKHVVRGLDRSVGVAQLAPAPQPRVQDVAQVAVAAPVTASVAEQSGVASPVWGAYRGFPDTAMEAFKACVAGFPQAPRKALLDAAGRAQRAVRSANALVAAPQDATNLVEYPSRDARVAGHMDTARQALLQAEKALVSVVNARMLEAYQVLLGVADENDVGDAVMMRLLESASQARFAVRGVTGNPAWWGRYETRLADLRKARLTAREEREMLFRDRHEAAYEARLVEQRRRDQAQHARAAAKRG